jgi:predicted membrane protein
MCLQGRQGKRSEMRERFSRFMWGRYGNDNFNQFLMFCAMALLVISLFLRGPFYLLAIIVMVYAYYRMFSKNIAKRSAENQWYLKKSMKARSFIQKKKREFSQRKQYHIYKCPKCKQKIRVPRGRGRIAITCRKCGNEFVRKS